MLLLIFTEPLCVANVSAPLRFLDGMSFRGLFGLPIAIRRALADETRVMTEETPVFMY